MEGSFDLARLEWRIEGRCRRWAPAVAVALGDGGRASI